MMGVGTDIIQISEFRKQLHDKASVFVVKSFTDREIAYSTSNISNRPEQHLAVRYAAKEAFIKAWSSMHVGSPPILNQPKFTDIEVVKDRFGRPSIQLHGQLLELLNDTVSTVSLSHDGDYAIATVLLRSVS